MTAVITLSVNSFYGWRIHKMSKHNWWLTGPIAFLSVARVGLAFTTTAEMMITKTFPEFATKFRILFTSGLFVSAVTDVVVSVARYYYLRNLKQGYLPLNLRNWYRHQYTWNRPLGLSMIRATTSDGNRVHAHERANTIPGGSPNKHAHTRSIDDGRVEVYVEHQVEYNVGDFIPEDLDALEAHSHKSGEIPSATGLRL
ncbi:hypothetical protein EV368DRAFT_63673 [Lentinula lateritia]|nr:hypothetical protein EV368DRAFT_63673 [Lentinula lateritia]